MNPPCEITTDFFFTCGHTVTSRRCRNPARLWRDESYHHPTSACDGTCPTRHLPTTIHMRLQCTWCRLHPRVPVTSSVRSDPGVDRLDAAELQRRRDFYLGRPRVGLSDAQRADFFGGQARRAYWETYKRLEHEFSDRQGMDWRERRYFVGGGGRDERLYGPLDRGSISEDEDGECQICMESLKEGAAPVVLPCHDMHRFHTDCLDEWLPDHGTCPTCRAHYTIFTFQEWEEVYEHRPFVRFFFAPRPVPPPLGPEVDGVRLERVAQVVNAWLEPDVAEEWNGFMQAQQQVQA